MRTIFFRPGRYESPDLDGALSTLWAHVAETYVAFGAELEGDDRPWTQKLAAWLRDGPWSVPEDDQDAAGNFALAPAKEEFPVSRVVVAVYGDAPYEGEAACILELPPAPRRTGRAGPLVDACARGDVTAAKEAIAAGASPSELDKDGNTPLHHAVAAGSLAVVQALVEAGADPNAQSEYMNPPLFAARRGKARSARVGPFAVRLAGEAHASVLTWLVEHGADATARGVDGATLVDLVIASPPLDERVVRWLIERGASSRLMRRTWRGPLEDLISDLDTRSKKERALVPDQVRVLCWLGCDPNARDEGGETALYKFLATGYSRREVEPEVLVGIARALMECGARDEPDEDGHRPSDLAGEWVEHSPGGLGHYADVARVFAGG